MVFTFLVLATIDGEIIEIAMHLIECNPGHI